MTKIRGATLLYVRAREKVFWLPTPLWRITNNIELVSYWNFFFYRTLVTYALQNHDDDEVRILFNI